MPMLFSFSQRLFKFLSLLIPEGDVSPRHKAAYKKDHGQEHEWRPRPNTNEYKERVQAAQTYGQHYSRNQHGKRQYRAVMRARIGE